MAFRGLFIGIDRYQSPNIDAPSCAWRDAVDLEASFVDTLDGTKTLFVDRDATRERIAAELAALVSCDPDDIVAIGFSGHGGETREYVADDSDVYDIATKAIPLDAVSWRLRDERGAEPN